MGGMKMGEKGRMTGTKEGGSEQGMDVGER